MAQRHHRIIAAIDPLPSGEKQVRHFATIIQSHNPDAVLWVILCGDMGFGFESCYAPFLTPSQWVKQTQADLQSRLHQLLSSMGIHQSEFKLLPGAPSQALAALSKAWNADLVLTSKAYSGLVSIHDKPVRFPGGWISKFFPNTLLSCKIRNYSAP